MSAAPAGRSATAQGAAAGGWRVEADGRIAGHASLFGVADSAGDVVERGAFRASLAERGAARVRLLWQHDPAEPIGVWTRIVEDETGLFVEGRLADGTTRGREAMALIRQGAIDGLSIGFRTRRAARLPGGRGRRLLALDLWEVSVVTFPAQERARLRPLIPAPPTEPGETELLAMIDGAAADLRRARAGAAPPPNPFNPRATKDAARALERA